MDADTRRPRHESRHVVNRDLFTKLNRPKVVLTPHNAADTDPDEISKYVARQIERFEAGGALENVVDRKWGY